MLDVIGDAIFRVEGIRAVSPLLAAAVVLLLVGGSAWILERRVRGIEVVA
jgi:hypothetical protein